MKRCLALFFVLVTTSTVSATDTPSTFNAATATNAVGLDLYRQLAAKSPTGNLVLAPYSIQSALALVYAGAEGTTRTEMAGVLHFPADDAALHRGFANLRGSLERAIETSQEVAARRRRNGGSIDPITLHTANRLFGQQGYAFRRPFLAQLRDHFAAPFEALDFSGRTEIARDTINDWVGEQTRGKIAQLIPRGALGTDTRLVLVNALYFKAAWTAPFPKPQTAPLPFHLADGTTREVRTMHQTGFIGHTAEDGLTVVALDYVGAGIQFLIILPDAGTTVDTAAAQLTPEHLARWSRLKDQVHPRVSLYLPRFRVEGATVPLGEPLRALGVRHAFDRPSGTANFDRIAPRRPDDYLALSEVFHQTFVELDEEGTVAAAATAASMVTLGSVMVPKETIEVRVDRPFLFAIQERASGACLFLGRITNP